MSYILWSLMWTLVAIPAITCVIFTHRRLHVRRELLKQTLLSMGLEDAYMRARHGDVPASERLQKFDVSFGGDFGIGFRFLDYLWPVALFTALSLVGWFLAFNSFYHSFSPVFDAWKLPLPFAYGFAGAFLASVLSFFDGYRKFSLDPGVCYSATYRILFSSTAAYLTAGLFADKINAALFAFGVGLFPAEETWNFITGKTAKALGVAAAEGEPGAELMKIQGLEDRETRQKLLYIDINSIQALATYDPLLLFCKTTIPLRTVIDIIDKAILYLYIGDTIKDLRQYGINGAIELVALVQLADKKPAYTASGDNRTFVPFFNSIDTGQLITDLCKVIKQTPDELKAFLYNLYYDPQVCLIYNIWGRYMDTHPPQPAPKAASTASGVL